MAAASTPCVAALDQGTTSSRCVVYRVLDGGAGLEVVGSAQLEHAQHRPRAGWCEHDPAELVEKCSACVDGALDAAAEHLQAQGRGPPAVKGLGITNQRETTVVWDARTGKAICNAVVWLDTRTADVAERLAKEGGAAGKDRFRAATGLPISTYFSGVKLAWLLENVPEVKAAADAGHARFGTVDSWLVYNLTGGASEGGVHVTDVTNASRTMMMDIEKRAWDPELCAAFGVPASMLPEIRSCAETYGSVVDGRLAGVPVCGILGDQHAAALGQRCRPGEAKNTYGTGCFLLLNTGERPVPSKAGLLTTLSFQLGPDATPQYALEGAIAIAGAGVGFLRDNLGIIESAKDVEPLAASVPDTADVYFVPAFNGLFAPRWRDDARGVLAGLTTFATKAHVARAMLEAICFQTRDVIDAMRKDADGMELGALRVDGGATANNLLMQLQADLLGVPVVRPADIETTARGAAIAAAIAQGLLTQDDVFSPVAGGTGDALFSPAVDADERDRRFARWTKAVERSLSWTD